jgi:hypothetical protein
VSDELLKKLKYKTGRALVIGSVPEGFELGIEADRTVEGLYEFVMLFVGSSSEVREQFPKALSALQEDAVFWVAYPKQSSKVKTDINRDSLWRLADEISDYRPVSNVAVDEKWSALRFRHKDKVKK